MDKVLKESLLLYEREQEQRKIAESIKNTEIEKMNVEQNSKQTGIKRKFSSLSENQIYHLQSIVNHTGTLAFAGHYVADVFDPNDSSWKHFNDAVMEKISEEQVLAKSSTSYILFYVHENSWLNKKKIKERE